MDQESQIRNHYNNIIAAGQLLGLKFNQDFVKIDDNYFNKIWFTKEVDYPKNKKEKLDVVVWSNTFPIDINVASKSYMERSQQLEQEINLINDQIVKLNKFLNKNNG